MKQSFCRENKSSLKYNHIKKKKQQQKQQNKQPPMLSKQSHQAYLIFKNQIREKELKSIPRSQDKIKKDIILGNIYEDGGTMSALGNKLTP